MVDVIDETVRADLNNTNNRKKAVEALSERQQEEAIQLNRAYTVALKSSAKVASVYFNDAIMVNCPQIPEYFKMELNNLNGTLSVTRDQESKARIEKKMKNLEVIKRSVRIIFVLRFYYNIYHYIVFINSYF